MKESFFQFSNPQLINIEFCINKNFKEDLFKGFSIESNVTKRIIEEETEAMVDLDLVIGEKDERYPFYISIIMSGLFRCDKKANFDKLLNSNAPALLLSYARPIVALVTSQSGYPSFNLPFMNFTEG